MTPPEQQAPEQIEQQAQSNGAPPKVADGIELIGEYEDSGYKEPPSIARRADGQIIQLPKLLYLIAENADGRQSYEDIAARVTEESGQELGPGDVKFLVEEKLRPLGVLAGPDGQSPQTQKVDPLLGLKFKVSVVPERIVHAITTLFYPFFFPPVWIAALAGVIAVDVWLFFFHGVAQPARELVYNPLLAIMILGLVVVATAFHEIGHATATRYGGAKPGVMGAGLYVVWPVFYTDVTDAYRLNRGGRLRTDLGGVYFNVLFILATTAAYFATGFEPLLIVVLVQHFQIIQQLLPLLRLDGYYILSDLTGVPDLFTRLGPTLKSLLPGKKDERVDELKPWVRVVVNAWVLLLIPSLAVLFGFMLLNAPRILATVWDSFLVHYDRAGEAFDGGQALKGVVNGAQMLILALPAVGFALSFSRAGWKGFAGGWRWAEGHPGRRLGLVSGTAMFIALLGFIWWPNGEYKPIQPDERGTVVGAVRQLNAVPTGRPSLTPEREEELGGAPTVRDEDEPGTTEEPTSTSPTETTSTQPTETTSTEPASTEPASTEPASTEPAVTTTEPTATETTTTPVTTTTPP